MKKILVTGAAGFIGHSLARHFMAQGAQVFVDVSRDDAGATKRWPLTDAGLLQAMGGEVPDAILHAAGSGTVAKVAAQPALELPANLGALLAVLLYAQHHAPKARVVLLSSAALYGNAPPSPQREDEARAPLSLYGLAKAQAEQLASHYAAHHGVQATAVRLFSVYGPGLRKQLLWDAMNKFVAGNPVFFGTGQERRDWLHIDDVCRFMDQLLQTPARRDFDVYNCAGSPASTAEVLSQMARAAGAAPPRFSGQSRAGDPQSLLADCSKAQLELSWRAEVSWSQGVADYAKWFLNSRAAPLATKASR
jgi:UDP-glucose 4-epimerase